MLQTCKFKHNLFTLIASRLKHFGCIYMIPDLIPIFSNAQDIVHYSGKTLVNVDYHHGQLSPAMGVQNIQVMLERIVFRTGDPRYFPNAETPSEQSYDLPKAGIPVESVVYYIKALRTYE